jgi:hypothetical protein
MKFETELFYMLMRTFTRALYVSLLRCFPLSGIVRILPLLAIPFILCCVVEAQTPASSSGIVESTVFVVDSEPVSPLPDATIELKSPNTFQTESDSTGAYSFREVDPGAYTRVSVLCGKDLIREPFLLLMSDHIFDPARDAALLHQPPGKQEVRLAADRKIDAVFELDDATKVRLKAHLIVEIGKNLRGYNALNTGMFLCQPSLFLWLENALTNGNCSLSDGLRLMGQSRAFKGFDIGDRFWQDVDTSAALDYAREAVYAQPRSIRADERPAHV